MYQLYFIIPIFFILLLCVPFVIIIWQFVKVNNKNDKKIIQKNIGLSIGIVIYIAVLFFIYYNIRDIL